MSRIGTVEATMSTAFNDMQAARLPLQLSYFSATDWFGSSRTLSKARSPYSGYSLTWEFLGKVVPARLKSFL
jgi:hypothetical protein